MPAKITFRREVLSRLTARAKTYLRARLGADHGQGLVEMALILPLMCLLLLGVIDFGRAYYLSIVIENAASAGALYGAQYPADTDGMKKAVAADATNVPGTMVTTADFGCICSQSSAPLTGPDNECNAPPSCAGSGNTPVTYVHVKTTATYKVLFPWPGIPSSFNLAGEARMRATE